MGNIFKIKHGNGVPSSSNLEDREFGYDDTNNQLYIGREGIEPRKVLSEDASNIAHTQNLNIGQYTFYSSGSRLTLKNTGGGN